MILHIDTKDRKQIKVSLKKDGKVVKSLSKQNEYGSQVLLPLIDRILKTKDLKPEDLEEIEVETGPGSFTGLRVGISIANALSFAGLVRVNGRKIGKIEEPRY